MPQRFNRTPNKQPRRGRRQRGGRSPQAEPGPKLNSKVPDGVTQTDSTKHHSQPTIDGQKRD